MRADGEYLTVLHESRERKLALAELARKKEGAVSERKGLRRQRCYAREKKEFGGNNK
jgi:hypothetical protein